MKILLVEDEEATARFVRQGLSEEGFVVDWAATAPQAELAVHDHDYQAILLDIMLPGGDGLNLCRRWRSQGEEFPILLLSARDSVNDRVCGLEGGADDYLVKPFAFSELLARLRALLRRRHDLARPVLSCGDLQLDPIAQQALWKQQALQLSRREYLLLQVLLEHAGETVSRTTLWEQAWETGSEPNSNAVDVYIGYLRTKLGEGRGLLQTVRGFGYRLQAPQ